MYIYINYIYIHKYALEGEKIEEEKNALRRKAESRLSHFRQMQQCGSLFVTFRHVESLCVLLVFIWQVSEEL